MRREGGEREGRGRGEEDIKGGIRQRHRGIKGNGGSRMRGNVKAGCRVEERR